MMSNDFTNNFADYKNPSTNQSTDPNRNFIQDLISTTSAAAAPFNGRKNTQTINKNNRSSKSQRNSMRI